MLRMSFYLTVLGQKVGLNPQLTAVTDMQTLQTVILSVFMFVKFTFDTIVGRFALIN
jgi:hypothetical protein